MSEYLPEIRLRQDGRQLAAVEREFADVDRGTVARFVRLQQALPGAVLGVVDDGGAALYLGVHVQQQLVAFGSNVDQLFVERQLKLVYTLSVHLDSRTGQSVTGLHWRHLATDHSNTTVGLDRGTSFWYSKRVGRHIFVSRETISRRISC